MTRGTRAAGAALRVAWAPVALDHLSVYGAVEGQLLFPRDLVAGGAVALGAEWAFTQRLALAAEAPYVFLASAPARYRTSYFMPGLAVSWRP